MTLEIAVIGLTLLGVLSPLLTFTTLFQQKEWRLDRLREHLRRDGWWKSLIGKSRLYLLAILFLIGAGIFACLQMGIFPDIQEEVGGPYSDMHIGSLGAFILIGIFFLVWIGSFAVLSLVQILLRKQRMPVWTNKARLIVMLSIVLNGVLLIFYPLFEFVLPVIQALVVLCSWLLLKPIDYVLKKRVMDRAMRLRSQMQNPIVIGIAGSVGKTTVKELIAHLTQDLHPLVTPAHVNTEMGVAQWLLSKRSALLRPTSSLLIIEMGAYRKGEIALLCRIAQPTIGVMTALGSDHVALFGSEENIIKANGELIESLPKTGHAFFYGDNEGCRVLAKRATCPATIAKTGHSEHPPLEGRHNAFNVTLASTVARHLGVKDERIEELLETIKPQAHTFNVTNERGVLLLDDTYNISPLSMNAALDWADVVAKRPRVLLTSGLQETGADEDRYLTKLGAKAAMSIERVIFTDKHGADVFAKAFGKPVEILNKDTERVAAGSVLLAVGRMPLSTVQRLLP